MSVQLVHPDMLKDRFPVDRLSIETTESLSDLPSPVGQGRAVEATRFGTHIRASGYNIYALGSSGVGKHHIIDQLLHESARRDQIPREWVYVNNFSDRAQPVLLSFAPGEAKIFQSEVQQFIEDLRVAIPSLFDSQRYRVRRDNLIKEYKDHQDQIIAELQTRAKKEGLCLVTISGRLLFVPANSEGEVLSGQDLEKMSEAEQKQVQERGTQFNDELAVIVNQFPIEERQLESRIKSLNREMILFVVETMAKNLREKYRGDMKVSSHISSLVKDILDNAKIFRRKRDEFPGQGEIDGQIKRYAVNVMVDHSDDGEAPVVYEDHPTFMNLVGQIEHESQMGALVTDFTMIKAGALHRANGGYLVLDAFKLLSSPYAWEGLKRALKSESIRTESLGQVYSLVSTVSLKPEPIPLRCKVVLIGSPEIYQILVQYDPEFLDLFKISADFEDDMPRGAVDETTFAALIASLARRHHVRHLDVSGVARVYEHAMRLSADKERLSLNLRLITDLLKEADHFAEEAGLKVISQGLVHKAIQAQRHRSSRIYERLIEETKLGTLLIDVDGQCVGQVNGLSVYEFGNHFFGHPTRITAVVRMGDGHVIDIEREVKMGGPIHSKGVLILSGFLKSRFAVDVPLSISASLVFEQSYAEVEGDSASLAELACLLSALSHVPLKQGVAVTGSVNQLGVVQPVGAINEKIEGFFDLCRRKGLTGEQGVVIPGANLRHLMLRDDVIHAVQEKRFSVIAVDSVDDCMHVLTGIEPKLVNDQVEARLRLFAKHSLKFRQDGASAEER